MKNGKLFQYIFMGAFVFFIIVGAILFSTYRAGDKNVVNVNITMWGTLPESSFTTFMAHYFSQANLKYTVNYVEKDPAVFDTDLVEALASGSGPDAIIMPEDMIVRYSNKIYPIPYALLPQLTFKQTFVQEGELYLNDKGIMALPFSVDPLVMYWNRDIFNNVSLTKSPATWTELANLAPKITKKDLAQNILRSAAALGEFRNVTNAKEIFSAQLIQNVDDANSNNRSGSSLSPIVNLNPDGTLASTLNEDFGQSVSPTTLTLGFFTNFSNPVKNEYSWNRSLPNSLDDFTNGDLAIYFGFASEFTKIKSKNPNLNFDVSFLPQVAGTKVYSTYGRMLGMAIMKNSSSPSGAYTAISALTSADAFPFWNTIFNLPSARRDVLDQAESSAVKTVFNKSAIMSKGWLDPDKTQTGAIFQEMVESFTTGRENMAEAISAASDRLGALLNKTI